MASKPFQFKQFAVADENCTHKVGTDGVLLGCWADIKPTDSTLLDIGAGSGVIALMLAQRSAPQAKIDAIEIEGKDATEARENVRRSPWPSKIKVWHAPAQSFAPDYRYDVIVSNPPFFVGSLRPPDKKRTQARHTETLSFGELIRTVNRLLTPEGRFSVILPVAEGLKFIELALSVDMHLSRKTSFQSRKHKPVERLLLEFSRQPGTCEAGSIALYDQGEQWSDAYQGLTEAFYLTGNGKNRDGSKF